MKKRRNEDEFELVIVDCQAYKGCTALNKLTSNRKSTSVESKIQNTSIKAIKMHDIVCYC